MIKMTFVAASIAAVISITAFAGDIDKGAVIGGAVGGGVGGAVGSKVGGTAGAAIGGAIGGGLGAAVGSDGGSKERVVVKEKVIEREVRVVDSDANHPPGHDRGKKRGWKKHHGHGHDD